MWRPLRVQSLTVSVSKPQVGLHGIQQRRFADAALAGRDRFASAEQTLQFLDARRRRGAGQNHLVAEPGVHSQDRLQADGIDQVALVDAQDRPHASFVGADQQAIDQIGLQAVDRRPRRQSVPGRCWRR